MICEKCGKNNPTKNTVCSSCNQPLPSSSNCGGFADILTINVNVPEVPTSSTSVISSASSARTDAAINRLTSATTALTKKNNMLMFFGICASVIALIAIIVAISSIAVSGSIGNSLGEKITKMETSLTELKQRPSGIFEKTDDGTSTFKYDAITDIMVYELLKDKISVDLSSDWNLLVNGWTDSENNVVIPPYNFADISQNDTDTFSSYITTLQNIENYLLCSKEYLSDASLASVKNYVFSAISNAFSPDSDSSSAYEWLINYPTIKEFFETSDNYTDKKNTLEEAYTKVFELCTMLSPSGFDSITKESYTDSYNVYVDNLVTYNEMASEFKNIFNVTYSENESSQLLSEEAAYDLYNTNIYKYFTDFKIIFHTDKDTTYVIKNDERLCVNEVSVEATQNENQESTAQDSDKTGEAVNAEKFIIPEHKEIEEYTFEGWSGFGKNNYNIDFTEKELISGTVNDVFETFDLTNTPEDELPDKIIDLYPVYHSAADYTISFKLKTADTETELYSITKKEPYKLTENDIININSKIQTSDNQTFLHWIYEDGSKTKSSEDFALDTIKNSAGTWYAFCIPKL